MGILLAVVCGVASGVAVDVSVVTAAAIAVAAASLAVLPPPSSLSGCRPVPGPSLSLWRWWRRGLLYVVVGAMAMAYGGRARDETLAEPLATHLGAVLDDRNAPPIWIEGTLASDASATDDGALLAVSVRRVRLSQSEPWQAVEGRASIGVNGAQAQVAMRAWTRGRTIRLPALVKRPQVWLNDGGPSLRWQRLRQFADIGGSVKSAALVDVGRGPRLEEAAAWVRADVRRAADRFVRPWSAQSAAVVSAILIGDRTGLDAAVIRNLQQAGTYHVIAISGGNIAIVAGVVLLVGRVCFRRPWPTLVATMGVVLAYGWLVGDQASVERAVTAAAIVLASELAGWAMAPLRVLLLAAVVLLLCDPLVAIDAGAWLSFGATAGILLLAPVLMAQVVSRARPWTTAAWALVIASASAELALMPVSADLFSRVGVAGLALNFLAIPAMAVVQFAGTALVIVAHLSPALARVAAWIAHAGVVVLIGSARALEWAPWLSWRTPPVWLGWTAIYYVAAATALWWRARPRVALAAGLSALAALLLIVVPLPPRSTLPPGWLRVAMLDIGQGDSIAVQFPTGQSMLVDAGGSATGFDISGRVIQPALWALGVRRLDWLAVTHGDVDHAGGAPGVFRDFAPREIWEGVPVWRDGRMQGLRAAAAVADTAWKRVIAGDSMEVGGAAVDVLNPVAPDWERRQTRNDDSIVLRLRFGDVSVLLTGDAGQAIEDALPFDRAAPPRLRILKVAHHGSRTSSSPRLLTEWLPQVALVSVGRGNTFGHPAPDVMARYAGLGITVFRTDRDGEIILETDGREVRIRTASGRTMVLSGLGR